LLAVLLGQPDGTFQLEDALTSPVSSPRWHDRHLDELLPVTANRAVARFAEEEALVAQNIRLL
jgi:hypothetical protein